MFISKATLFAILPAYVAATMMANDWSQPCNSGRCSYTAGDGKHDAWSTLEINADSPTSIADITPAAGWEILNCDATTTDPQDIRLVCVDKSKGCDLVYEGGDINTIVRLPDSCAGGPFARISRTWKHKDQSLPARLAKRSIIDPVMGFNIDFDFAQIPVEKGHVSLTVAATNDPIQRAAIRPAAAKRSLAPLRHATKRGRANAVIKDFTDASHHEMPKISKRFLGGIVDGIKDGIDSAIDFGGDLIDKGKDAIDGVVDAVGDGVSTVGETVGGIVDDVTGEIVDVVDAVGEATEFDKEFSKEFELINVDERDKNLIDLTVSCPLNGFASVAVGIKVDVKELKAQVNARVGFIVVGSIVPPKIDDIAFTGGLNGDINTIINIIAKATGTVTSGPITLFTVGIPGLSFPGIITVGPALSIVAEAKATLGVTADIEAAISYKIPNIEMVFPPEQGESIGSVEPASDAPLKFSVGASAEIKATAEAHLIPRVQIGAEILNGAAKANVFLAIDGSAILSASLTAGAEATPVDGDLANVDFTRELETSFGGRVAFDLGVAVKAGIEGILPGLINAGLTHPIFSTTLNVFEQTFGDAPLRKRGLLLLEERQEQISLSCPDPVAATPTNAVPLNPTPNPEPAPAPVEP